MPRNLVDDEIDRLKASLSAAHARREELWKRAERAESELAAAQAERDRLQAMAPRLVWYVGEEGFTLSLCIDQLVQVLWKWLPAEGLDRATKIRSIQTWCAATIPSIPLPDFPGAL